MPTNKLWIEHTERAAWDSVEALRERLAKAEERLQVLLPNLERVPRLLDLLQRAKREYAATAHGFDEVVEELMRRLESTQAELTAARTPEPLVTNFQVAPPRARFDSEDLDELASQQTSDDSDLTSFTRAMCRREERAENELPRDVNRLLALAESKLDDLTELEGTELRSAALELAIVAGRIYAASDESTSGRASGSSTPPDSE